VPAGRSASSILIAVAAAGVMAIPAHAAKLKQHTVVAFNRYIQATEQRMADDLHDGHFLVIDDLPGPERQAAYAKLRSGMLHIEHVQTPENGKRIEIPDGMIHDWVGVVFIPKATLPQALAVLEDYSRYQDIYNPTIQRSKLLSHDGESYQVYLRYFPQGIVTVAFDANFDIRYTLLGDGRALIRSYSTRVAEVADDGQPDEHVLPVGNDHGYTWRFYNYWHVEQKDGGVYAQVEAVALSRNIPFVFRWLIDPLVESIPRKLLAEMLTATRDSVEKAAARRASDLPVPSQPAYFTSSNGGGAGPQSGAARRVFAAHLR
jgi:hypothetical protein